MPAQVLYPVFDPFDQAPGKNVQKYDLCLPVGSLFHYPLHVFLPFPVLVLLTENFNHYLSSGGCEFDGIRNQVGNNVHQFFRIIISINWVTINIQLYFNILILGKAMKGTNNVLHIFFYVAMNKVQLHAVRLLFSKYPASGLPIGEVTGFAL